MHSFQSSVDFLAPHELQGVIDTWAWPGRLEWRPERAY